MECVHVNTLSDIPEFVATQNYNLEIIHIIPLVFLYIPHLIVSGFKQWSSKFSLSNMFFVPLSSFFLV